MPAALESNRRSLRSSFNSRSDAATRRRRLFLEQLEHRSLLAAVGNGLGAAPDFYSLDEDTTLNVSAPGVLGNDAGTSAVLIASPANGAVSFTSDGSFTYTPLADFYGTDSFTYQALDGELISDEITVTLTVNDVPEPPPPAPVAGDDSYSTDEDTLLTIGGAGVLDNDQGQSITAAVTSGPANGSVTMNPDGSFTYTPNENFHGSDSFAYSVTDSTNQTDDAQVTITVNAINDPPVAIDVGFSAYEDQQLMVYSSIGNGLLYGASDPDGDYNLTPQLVSQASNGYVDFSYYGSFIYTPAAEFSGTDTFTYQISDGNGGYSNVATVTIQVDAVNDAPVAVEDYFTLAEDDYTFSGNLLTNDSDIDSPTFSPTLATGVSNGNLIVQMDGSFVYNPYANFFGTDSFTYYVSDGLAQSNTVTVWLTITEVNDAPIGAPDAYTTNEDNGLYITGGWFSVLYNDNDAETDSLSLTATLVTAPASGTFWLNADGGFSYTPNQDFYGEDTFTYQASDGQLLSEITTVTITVEPINDIPTASDQSYTLDEDTPLTITDPNLGLLAGVTDVDGPALSVAVYNQPQYGQLIIDDPNTGTFTYTPNENFFGNDYFTYLVSDGSASAFATANLTISGVNDAPQANGESFTLNEGESLNAGGLLDNDDDIEGDSLWTSPDGSPSHGSVTVGSDGTFTYTPTANYSGPDSFTYLVNDWGASTVATVALMVNAVATPKLSINDATATEAEGAELVFEVTLDADANGPFTVDFATVKLSAEDAPTLHILSLGNTLSTQDYVAKNDMLTSTGAKGVIGQIRISLTNDNIAELTENLQVKLSNIQSTNPAAPSNVTFADDVGEGTINDDDVIRAEFFGTPASPTNEGTGSNTRLPFQVSLFRPGPGVEPLAMADGPITITYAIEGKGDTSSIAGVTLSASTNDYVNVSGGTLTLPAYSTGGTIFIDIVGDRTVEESLESFNVVIKTITAGGRTATVAAPNAFGAFNMVISDDDSAQVVFSQTSPFSISEGVGGGFFLPGTVTINVRLTAPVDVPVTANVFTLTPLAPPLAFNLATSSATVNATQIDYNYTLDTFTFPADTWPQQFTFDIPIIDDNIVESDEIFEVKIALVGLASPRAVTAGPNLPVEIRDNDAAIISIHDRSIPETDAAGPTVGTVNYTLSQPSDSAISFVINATPGTALAGTDYNAAIYPLTVTVPPNTTSGTFSVQIFNDTTHTGDRTFTVTATGATSPLGTTNTVGISTTSGTATITIDEDEWPWE